MCLCQNITCASKILCAGRRYISIYKSKGHERGYGVRFHLCPMTGFFKRGNERSDSIKDGELLNKQNDCGLDAFAHLGCCVA